MRHQVVGGVMTILRRQLDQLGFSDRFDAVITAGSRHVITDCLGLLLTSADGLPAAGGRSGEPASW
ncbi:hypothetical protein ACFYO0_44490 [Streptomyces sp. NPDC006365]|uniref:hypothetical protein n=1 Tax=Streptomyces sp. NPDC006365 TaxID=3364744 RepID=UPI0036B76C29